jgi:hypothetical protein
MPLFSPFTPLFSLIFAITPFRFRYAIILLFAADIISRHASR